MAYRSVLARRIAAFIKHKPQDAAEEEFNQLARELFTFQYERNVWVRRLADTAGVVPNAVTRWQDVPAMPGAAFKEFDLSCVAPGRAVAVFHSSGTTGAQTSRHFLSRDALTLYEASLRRGFELALPERPARLWALMPTPRDAPQSSLSHMLGALGADCFFWDDNPQLASALDNVREPVTVFGTAFAFVALLDGAAQNWTLPPGSIVIETGGFKGRSRDVPRPEFYAMLAARLGMETHSIYSEYGMSEMASQFYGQGMSDEKRGPHWVRTRAINPATGSDAEPGAPGALRHFDLANFNSVCCLQTADWGTLTPHGFTLYGRAPGADIRGCSLTVEELWG